ncbi:MAG: 2-oxoglutarate dehydrogenase, E2 component, dihydrolipoamide succinyltransferase, partial [Actinobacteria bacterium]|nr:2-oxoglutarate dehydrogenase, E2 component, dihydrolipoamide succinyltransferase [Actinomycetota bacterium]
MTFSVTMPALGESVSEGTVTRWLKSEGDHVAMDEPLLEVSTDKVDTEIPSPVAGILQKIVVAIDQTVPVGAELAIIADGGAPASTPAPAAPVAAAPVTPPPAAPAPAAPVTPPPAVPVAPSAGTIITMPALGESVSEGTVTRWLKGVGDSVAVDEALLEVSTDKVDTEIPSPVAGTILSIDVPVDSTVPVGARLAVIGGAGASAPAAPVAAPPAPPVVAAPVISAPAPVAPPAPAPVAASAPVSQPADAYVTPIVRKLANDLGVNLANVKGSGVGGRIRKEDVEAAAPKSAAPVSTTTAAPAQRSAAAPVVATSPLRGTTVTMSRLRKVIAARMVESLQVSAQLTTVVEVDVTKIARLRDRSKATFEAREGVKLSFLPFFAVAVCE